MAFRIHEWLLAQWGLSIPIPAYFPLLALGMIAGMYVIGREARRQGIDINEMITLFAYGLVAVAIGSRLYVVVENLDHFLAHPREIFFFTETGLASHGGFLAGLLVIVVFVRVRRLPFLRLADALPAGFGLGYFFARIGCLLEGSCYGVVTHLPWGVRFPPGSVAYGNPPAEQALVTGGPMLTPPLHPTQLYAAAAGLCLFALALWLAPRKRFHGEVFFAGLLFYSATRVPIDALRGDLGGLTVVFGFLPSIQLVTVCIGLVALLGLGYLYLSSPTNSAEARVKGPV